MNTEYANFKDYELIPALYENIDRVFPKMNFIKKGGKWESRYHLDGNKDKQGGVVSYIYSNRKYLIIDHARSENKTIIDYYMENNGIDFHTAITQLSELCSLTPPSSEEWKDYEKKQTRREQINTMFVKALWGGGEKAAQVLDYLRNSRKWTDEEIKKTELGLITTEIRDSISDEDIVKNGSGVVMKSLGVDYFLTIPYRRGSSISGFKYRKIVDSKNDKYINSCGLDKSSKFFGIGIGIKDVVIVEGELDALHARAKGADNVVATSGGKAADTQIEDAIKRGADKFTLLFDKDDGGVSFIIPTIEAIQKTGKSIYVASLPDGVKDLDEYLINHSLSDFETIVKNSITYALYIYQRIAAKYNGIADKDGFTMKDRESFYQEVGKLLNSPYIKSYDREEIYKQIGKENSSLNIDTKGFRDWTDKEYYREQSKKRAEEAAKASSDIEKAVSSNDIEKAVKLMRETADKLNIQDKETEYAKVFSPLAPDDYGKYLSEIKDGIPTGFLFQNGVQKESLTLNSGLTFICGYRGHGKTSFLNNLALNEARRNVQLQNGKSVLYFSYEVDKRRLILDLLNTFVNDPYISRNPLNSILSYFKHNNFDKFKSYTRGGELNPKTNEYTISHFTKEKDIFLKEYLNSRALVIVEENYKVEELLRAIKWYVSSNSVSMVCIDYAQLIFSENYSRQRTEEIKSIVNNIKDFANKEGLPFVLAAQFNRAVDSPVSVDSKNIGEGGDFERIADTCIGLFNLKELHPLPKGAEEEREAKDLLGDLGVASYKNNDTLKPIQGKLFVRLMKRRYGYYPLDTILDWEGSTKHIEPNDKDALKVEQKQMEIFPTQKQTDI